MYTPSLKLMIRGSEEELEMLSPRCWPCWAWWWAPLSGGPAAPADSSSAPPVNCAPPRTAAPCPGEKDAGPQWENDLHVTVKSTRLNNENENNENNGFQLRLVTRLTFGYLLGRLRVFQCNRNYNIMDALWNTRMEEHYYVSPTQIYLHLNDGADADAAR